MADIFLIWLCVLTVFFFLLYLANEVIKGVKDWFRQNRFEKTKPTLDEKLNKFVSDIEEKVGRKLIFDDNPEQFTELPHVELKQEKYSEVKQVIEWDDWGDMSVLN